MKIHEYQAKGLLKRYGFPVPNGEVADTPREVREIAERIGKKVIVKAQVHAGGRGKGGGIKLADDPAAAESVASDILGMTLVTHQTGAKGKKVSKVLVEEASNIDNELYLGMVVDRERESIVIMASTEGGMEIEKVAAETPEKIIKEWVDPGTGLMPYQARRICFGLGLKGDSFKQGVKAVSNLVKLFGEMDASLAEINPLVVTAEGDILAVDAKINFDDNALYRHKDVVEFRDLAEEEPLETQASEFDLNYIKLDGNVGCMVNGAGLAMATMDIIKLNGGEPANFLDVGGAASVEGVERAFRILMSDPNVKAVLVNIFGGIVRCDRVASGMVEAIKNIGDVSVPIVVRLEGTNAEEGMTILKESGLDFQTAKGFQEAASLVVKTLEGGG